MSSLRTSLVVGALVGSAIAVPALATPAAPLPLASAVPSWATGVPASLDLPLSRVDFQIALRLRHADELNRIAHEVSEPSSPSYRHFLTKQDIDARYAPTLGALADVTRWLNASGISVDGVTPGRTLVMVHASAATVERALHVGLGEFRVGGLTLRAPLSEPTIPTGLRSVVAGIEGLAQTPMHTARAGTNPNPLPDPIKTPVDTPPAAAFVNARPCAAYYGQKTPAGVPGYLGRHRPEAICGYTPLQVRSAYGLDKVKWTGAGQTVAVVDAYASPTLADDVNTWSRRHGMPPFKPGQLSQVDYPTATQTPESPVGVIDPQGWAGEETLDVEAVHTTAPGANIVYVAAATPFNGPLNVAIAEAVEGDLAQIVSDSWGSNGDNPLPTDKLVFDQISMQAAAKGIGIYFSSGDNGDEQETTGTRSADFPATSDLVTAVGGTTLEIGSKGQYLGEVYWGTRKAVREGSGWNLDKTTLSGAGGGGVSTSYPEPSWQKGVVPNSLATHGGISPGRVVPDISMVADSTTGILEGLTQTFKNGKVAYGEYRIGGTSVSCPLFAGLMAAADQASGKQHGDVAPALYAHRTGGTVRDPAAAPIAGDYTSLANVRPDYADTTDPTSAVTFSLRILGNLASLSALRGYDDSTGLGTPYAPRLLLALR